MTQGEVDKVQYQFQIDGRSAGPVRGKFSDAAADAVATGYAVWSDYSAGTIRLNDQASIARLAVSVSIVVSGMTK